VVAKHGFIHEEKHTLVTGNALQSLTQRHIFFYVVIVGMTPDG
jgi:hypothetical protein